MFSKFPFISLFSLGLILSSQIGFSAEGGGQHGGSGQAKTFMVGRPDKVTGLEFATDLENQTDLNNLEGDEISDESETLAEE